MKRELTDNCYLSVENCVFPKKKWGKTYKKSFPGEKNSENSAFLVDEFDDLSKSNKPKAAKKLAEKFWPGPLTMILPKSEKVPTCVTAGLSSVAVRCPSHVVARNLIKYCGLPIAAPSANISGKPSPTKAEHVFSDLNGRIPLVIDGGESEEGVESTVIDVTGDIPVILRPGGITAEMIKKVLPLLTEDEEAIFKRGRNAKTHFTPKHGELIQYRRATGFEALMGYLYVSGNVLRAKELFTLAFAKENQD